MTRKITIEIKDDLDRILGTRSLRVPSDVDRIDVSCSTHETDNEDVTGTFEISPFPTAVRSWAWWFSSLGAGPFDIVWATERAFPGMGRDDRVGAFQLESDNLVVMGRLRGDGSAYVGIDNSITYRSITRCPFTFSGDPFGGAKKSRFANAVIWLSTPEGAEWSSKWMTPRNLRAAPYKEFIV